MEDSELNNYGDNHSPQHVVRPIDEISTKERLKFYCKPRYKVRRVKRKGAFLVLVWNFLAVCVLCFTMNFPYCETKTIVGQILFGLTLPLAGWLADACIGRYKMIYCSAWILWAATILETLHVVIGEQLHNYYHISTVVESILLGLMGIGLGSFLSTLLQFGVDQLQDASTDEISAFIVWYIWTTWCSLLITYLSLRYRQWNHQYFHLLGNLFVCINLSLILILLLCCNSWLIKEPTSQNPFKLIYKVSKYALKNKYLKRRSAFTYCEESSIGRIDYGKVKYGGPFTTEQVEDVKMFYRLLPIAIIAGILTGEMITGEIFLAYNLKNQFVVTHAQGIKGINEDVISGIIPQTGPLLIILHEVLIYPIFNRCCSQITSIYKFIMGVLLLTITFLALMTFEILSRQAFLRSEYNDTIVCTFKANPIVANLNYNWIAIPDTLFVLSALLIFIGGLEFIAAQVPYSMKGVILGVTFCALFIANLLNIAINIPFKQRLSIWGAGVISCGFWYALLHIILCILVCTASALVIKWYKRRKRQDVLPNEHFYAERFYSNLLESRTS